MTPEQGPWKSHIPVLPGEIMDFLRPEAGSVIVDATLGAGGHSNLILEHTNGDIELLGMDKDKEMLVIAKERLKGYSSSCRFFNADFKDFDAVMKETGHKTVDGCIFDLGLSSLQIEDEKRGFSYMQKGPIDMRMDTNSDFKASDIVNGYSIEQLRRVFSDYSDERYPGRIAQALIKAREEKPLEDTVELAHVFRKAGQGRKGTKHPEAPLFMALRIEVNKEFSSIEQGIRSAAAYLKPGGRICVISFHSGEDRIVKNIFRNLQDQGILSILTKKPITPSRKECARNGRARSAKLRAAERRDAA